MEIKISKIRMCYNFSFIFFWGMIFSMPIGLFYKINFIGIKFSISYIFLVFFLFFSIICYFFVVQLKFTFFKSKIFKFFFLSFFIYIINSFYNGIDTKYLIFFVTFVASIVVGFLYKKEIIIFFSKSFVNVTYILTGIGIILYYFNIPLFDFDYAGGEFYFMNSFGYYRLSSILLNPNGFSYFLLLYFMIFFYSRKFFISYIMFFIIFISFILTDSRSALLGLLFSFIIFNFHYIKQKIFLFKSSIVCVLLFFVFLLGISSAGFLTQYDIRFSKFIIAIEYIFSSWRYFLTGVPSNILIEKDGIVFSDNMFLYLFLKMGFFSFMAFMCGYFYSILRTVKILFKGDDIEIKPYALFIVSTLFPMFFSNLLFFSPIYLLIGLSIGALERDYIDESEKSSYS
ncbi:hypothetical protein JL12_00935 [Gallibacterium anatis 10672-6]|uniref:O-antigen polymerase n=1 Tax=Gallibacterium anatis TaxID=750 RepID=UPI000531A8F4|nr:O-antigen polymerase [Gallibacterium anatis]KGQ52463.1 hypothetical protein JL12_00935 [Gallibacterium anatis 10672-6]